MQRTGPMSPDPAPEPTDTGSSPTAPSNGAGAAPWTTPDGGTADRLAQEVAEAARLRAEAGAAQRERLMYSWRLPMRRGPYLTGTAGPRRMGGLDAARGLALVGMMAVHMAPAACGLTSLPGILHQAHGRASILFAVIAGFSLGIISGGREPHGGDRLVRTRLRLLVRSAMLLVLAGLVSVLGTPVSIILGFYAAWLALALPFLRWSPRRLFILAAVTALLGQAVVIALPIVLTALGMSPYPVMVDGNAAMVDFFIIGTYPGAVWMAFIFLGLGLSRLDWSRARNLWRLVAVGALCAVLGYAGGWAASQTNPNALPDPYHLVSPADPLVCSGVTWSQTPSSSATGPVLPDAVASSLATPSDSPSAASSLPPSSIPSPSAPSSEATGSELESWGSESSRTSGEVGKDEPRVVESLATILPSLSTAAPHSGTPFEALGSAGVAMAVIGLFQLISRRLRYALAPLAALGSMSLTVYCTHLAAIWLARGVDYQASTTFFLSVTAILTAFAMLWLIVFARGPLEHLVHVVSVRATRAKD
ncbi:MAG: DUF418 domain-containing protein [Actinomyces sp.]|uniref:DUF418 domain-containing protein n=1 Tax=Actinomyces sp. TaxID=29317 RepID=UPI0026DAEEA1|nr:DUF418 domain-containing protein [Actinomyces sp.]MDO4242410.1 DUF418 domain-containing protein [Actinomyces sp.]